MRFQIESSVFSSSCLAEGTLVKFRRTMNTIDLFRSPLLGACNSHNKPMQRHFCRPVYTRYFSREIGQFQSTWARFHKDRTMRPHMNMSTCQHYSVLVIAIAHRRSSGDLNSSQIQTKNRSVCENTVTGIWCSCSLLVSSWPFARPGHMAQNQRCWDATCTVKVGLPKQSNSKQPGTCLCFGSPSVPLATQHVRYCTMWSWIRACKGPIDYNIPAVPDSLPS